MFLTMISIIILKEALDQATALLLRQIYSKEVRGGLHGKVRSKLLDVRENQQERQGETT